MTRAPAVAEPVAGREELLSGLLRTVPAAAAAQRTLAARLDEAVTSPSQVEASVRLSEGGARSGRVMIERAGADLFAAVCVALEVPALAQARRLIEACEGEGLPLIVGWDTGGAGPVAKLYANASDASRPSRARLMAHLGAALPGALAAPHVIGLNIGGGVVETKLYVQSRPGEAALPPECAAARSWEQRAIALGAAAGTVVSWDLADPPVPRALFVATRRHADDAVALLLDELPGYGAGALEALPFSPGPARSIGMSLGTPLGRSPSWTVYFKPRGAQAPVALLEPTLRCRAGAVEVGVFVEPDPEAPRALVRTARHAISYRAAEGVASGREVDVLMGWVGARVRLAEEAGRPVAAMLDSPPPPWRLVE